MNTPGRAQAGITDRQITHTPHRTAPHPTSVGQCTRTNLRGSPASHPDRLPARARMPAARLGVHGDGSEGLGRQGSGRIRRHANLVAHDEVCDMVSWSASWALRVFFDTQSLIRIRPTPCEGVHTRPPAAYFSLSKNDRFLDSCRFVDAMAQTRKTLFKFVRIRFAPTRALKSSLHSPTVRSNTQHSLFAPLREAK